MLCWTMERIAGPDGVLVPRQSGALEQADLEKVETLMKKLDAIFKKVCLLPYLTPRLLL